MGFELSARDRQRLDGVHPDLVRVVERAACGDVPFAVVEGVRSEERQRQLMEAGASQTMNSRHITAANGYGHAVDLAPLIDRSVSWDWPLYHRLAPIVKAAAAEEGVPVEWGGDWKKFKDGPHWQLPWREYPGRNPAFGVMGDADGGMAEGEPPEDYPYEIERKTTPMRSRTLWAGGGVLSSAGAAFAAIWNNASAVAIVCLTVIVCLVLIIMRERIRKFAEDLLP